MGFEKSSKIVGHCLWMIPNAKFVLDGYRKLIQLNFLTQSPPTSTNFENKVPLKFGNFRLCQCSGGPPVQIAVLRLNEFVFLQHKLCTVQSPSKNEKTASYNLSALDF
jgi:hypothetical protein